MLDFEETKDCIVEIALDEVMATGVMDLVMVLNEASFSFLHLDRGTRSRSMSYSRLVPLLS